MGDKALTSLQQALEQHDLSKLNAALHACSNSTSVASVLSCLGKALPGLVPFLAERSVIEHNLKPSASTPRKRGRQPRVEPKKEKDAVHYTDEQLTAVNQRLLTMRSGTTAVPFYLYRPDVEGADSCEVLGEGTFGVVCVAPGTPGVMKRFRSETHHSERVKEVDVLLRLRGTPNINQLTAVYVFNDKIEALLVPRLAAHLDQTPILEPTHVMDVIIGLARALAGMHEKGIAHMDICKQNVMVEGESRNVLLVDMGSSIIYQGPDTELYARANATRQAGDAAGMVRTRPVGHRTYRPPELLFSKKSHREPVLVDPSKVDVFAFSILCWELLHPGLVPFPDIISSGWSSVRNGTLRPSLEKLAADGEWSDLLARCWEHNAAERPAMKDVLEQLEQSRAKLLDEISVFMGGTRTPGRPKKRRNYADMGSDSGKGTKSEARESGEAASAKDGDGEAKEGDEEGEDSAQEEADDSDSEEPEPEGESEDEEMHSDSEVSSESVVVGRKRKRNIRADAVRTPRGLLAKERMKCPKCAYKSRRRDLFAIHLAKHDLSARSTAAISVPVVDVEPIDSPPRKRKRSDDAEGADVWVTIPGAESPDQPGDSKPGRAAATTTATTTTSTATATAPATSTAIATTTTAQPTRLENAMPMATTPATATPAITAKQQPLQLPRAHASLALDAIDHDDMHPVIDVAREDAYFVDQRDMLALAMLQGGVAPASLLTMMLGHDGGVSMPMFQRRLP